MKFLFVAPLVGAVVACLVSSSIAQAEVLGLPLDFAGTYHSYTELVYPPKRPRTASFSSGWRTHSLPLVFNSHPILPGDPAVIVSAGVGPGGIHVSSSIYSPGYHATLAAAGVMNEFFRVDAAGPILELMVHMYVHGSLDIGGLNGQVAEAYAALNVYPDVWLSGADIVEPGLLHTDAQSDVVSGTLTAPEVPHETNGDIVFAESRQPEVTRYRNVAEAGYSVGHRVSFLVPYNEIHDGFLFTAVGQVRVDVQAGTASALFGNSFEIVDVTLPNGDPVPGPIWFESGFTLNSAAVPEPASAFSMIFGLAVLLTCGRRKRRWLPE